MLFALTAVLLLLGSGDALAPHGVLAATRAVTRPYSSLRQPLVLRAAEDDKAANVAPSDAAAAPAETTEANPKPEPLMVGPFNLKDGNDWVTVFLSSIIAWQSIQIVQEVIQGLTNKSP